MNWDVRRLFRDFVTSVLPELPAATASRSERFGRSGWSRFYFWNQYDLERKLPAFRIYYNRCRVHSGIDGIELVVRGSNRRLADAIGFNAKKDARYTCVRFVQRERKTIKRMENAEPLIAFDRESPCAQFLSAKALWCAKILFGLSITSDCTESHAGRHGRHGIFVTQRPDSAREIIAHHNTVAACFRCPFPNDYEFASHKQFLDL